MENTETNVVVEENKGTETNDTNVNQTATKTEETTISKDLFDKSVSELNQKRKAAEEELEKLKEQLKSKMTEDELKQAELELKEKELENFRTNDKINKISLNLAKNGITNGEEIAKDFIDGNFDNVIAKMSAYFNDKIEDVKKQVQLAKLEETAKAATPATGSSVTSTEEDSFKSRYNKALQGGDKGAVASIIREAALKGITL